MEPVNGSNQSDMISYNRWPYWTTNNADIVYAQAGNDTVKGAGGNDILYGQNDHDRLYGENGNDILYGERGRDKLYGGHGRDSLAGAEWYGDYGKGDIDTLTGGSGSDKFYLGTSSRNFYIGNGNSDYALITDFQLGQDQILVKKANFDRYRLETTFTASGIGTRIVDVSAGDLIGIVEGVRPWSLFVRKGNSYTTIGQIGFDLT